MSPPETASPEPPLTEAAGVVKRFPGAAAPDGVSFGLRAGEAHAPGRDPGVVVVVRRCLSRVQRLT
ncbi:hypothetical protein ABTW95_18390 [Spirillospora sp. NPDC127506]